MSDVAVVAGRTHNLTELLERGTLALVADGDLGAGRRWFEHAYREADRIDDAEASAAAALGLSGLWVHESRTTPEGLSQQSRLRDALTRVDPRSSLALRLRIRLVGEASYRLGETAPILAALDEARRSGDAVARAEALSIAHHCLAGPEHSALRRDLAAELIVTSTQTGRRSDLLMGMLWQTVDLFLDADPHAERVLGELRTLLAEQDHMAVGYVAAAIEVMLAIRAGSFDQASALAEACLSRGRAAGDVDATWWYGSQLVAIRWFQGRLAETLPMLSDLVHSPTLSIVDNSCLAALAVAAAQAGDRHRAASALAALTGRGLAALPRASSWLATMAGVVETAYLLSDAATASAAYSLLLPYADRPMIGGLAVACFGSVEHALGVAALTTGDLDRAVEHLRAAVHRNLALAHLPAAVASRRRLALAYRQRGDLACADRESALAESDAALLGLAAEPAPQARVTRQGGIWRVAYGHRSVVVQHRIGMLYLAALVANPGQEIPAIELAAGAAALGTDLDAGLSSQPVLDRVAIQGYQYRLTQLRQELDELPWKSARAAQVRQERDWLLAELSAAAGFGGRTRRFTDNHERARIAVGKALRRALQQIADADALIGEHLAQCVRTGSRCAYWPLPEPVGPVPSGGCS